MNFSTLREYLIISKTKMANRYSVPLKYLVNLNSHSNFEFKGKKNLSQLPNGKSMKYKVEEISVR